MMRFIRNIIIIIATLVVVIGTVSLAWGIVGISKMFSYVEAHKGLMTVAAVGLIILLVIIKKIKSR